VNTTREQVTKLLDDAAAGRPLAASELLPLVYDQLRAIAQNRMKEERREHTLQATALVHEAYARLVGAGEIEWHNRAHFFFAAGEAMRRILIEHARARARVKRGGAEGKAAKRVPLDIVDLATDQDPEDVLAFEEAFRRLEEKEGRVAAVVRLRLFSGLSIDETAKAMGLSPRTVDTDWAFARAWLFRELGEQT
jgi:RNA polymerase sigma factor (TIGR02999 family)